MAFVIGSNFYWTGQEETGIAFVIYFGEVRGEEIIEEQEEESFSSKE